MKKRTYGMTVLAVALSMILTFSSCVQTYEVRAENLGASYKRTATEEGTVTDAFEQAFSAFAFQLFQSTVKEEKTGNKLVSPLSAMVCLSLIANGAEGATLEEMEAVLGMDVQALNRALYAYTTGLTSKQDAKMELANSVWFRNTDQRLSVKESFLQTLADWYRAEAYGAPFDENTRKDMDAWVSEHTDGMIKKMLDEPIDPNTMMYLVNALVFGAKWEKQYEKSQIQDREFTNAAGKKTAVKGLLSDENVYLEGDGVIGVAKPYKDGGYYFVGLLPEDPSEIMSDFIADLSGKTWQELWGNRSKETVKTMIPEFKTEDRTDLKGLLQDMGMERMFSPLAEFLPMAEYDGGSLYVSEVMQKTYLELDRNGTKAAAVTWGAMGVKSVAPIQMKTVYLDRPFLYMIVDAESGLPLFIGVQNEM